MKIEERHFKLLKEESIFVAHRREKDGAIQNLWNHLKEVSDLTGKFAMKIGLKHQGELIGLLHDLGKATIEFDQYIRSATGLIDPDEDEYVDAAGKKGKIDHSSAGAQIIYRYFANRGTESKYASEILSLIIASHHSALIDCLTPDGEDGYSKRMNKSDTKTRIVEATNNLDDAIRGQLDNLISDNNFISSFNKQVILLKEENDSDETFKFKIGLLTRFLLSCLIDADRLNTADFEFPEKKLLRNQGDYIDWSVLKDRLNSHLDGLEDNNGKTDTEKKVNSLRWSISDDCMRFSTKPKGLYQLTVPTGGGKTLSSLRFALNHVHHYDKQDNNDPDMDRIIYVIPFTAIIDQNADTVRKILENKSNDGTYIGNVVLEHHSNLTPEEETTRQKLLAENWDAPIVFTTMVQFLESLFGYGTRNARRMHQLANAVIIFDEIQTLPLKCVHLFNLAIRFLIKICGSTVVLCTATQPLLDKIKPIERALQITAEQQIVSDVSTLFKELKRVEVYDRCKIGGWKNTELAELAKEELEETGSVLVIVNKKEEAKTLYKLLQNQSNAKTFHLSTSMCPAHRMKILANIKECLQDKKPVICVSTQLIEAGVDIDFGSVIRFLAGLDSIAQAAGRCNRNGARPQMGRVFIVNPAEENLERLPDIQYGKLVAERVLDEFKTDPAQFDSDIIGPKAIERYYTYYFYAREAEMSYLVSSKSGVGRADNLFRFLSVNSLSVNEYQRINNVSPEIVMRQSFMAAAKEFQSIDSSGRGIIVPYGEGKRIICDLCAANELEKQYTLLKEAQRYSVNVLWYLFDDLVEQKIIREVQQGAGIFYLNNQYYSDAYGMSESPVKEMEFLNC